MVVLQVIDRVLYKLDDLVRPYVHKILVVIEPLLIDEVRTVISDWLTHINALLLVRTTTPELRDEKSFLTSPRPLDWPP